MTHRPEADDPLEDTVPPVTKSRSPLKASPLRLPGQSVHESLIELALAGLFPYLVIAITTFAAACLEWLAVLGHWSRHPVVFTAVAAAAIAVCTWRFASSRGRIAQLRLAMQGERAVGEELERLRTLGAEVFHDVPGEGFNLDHVVLSPRGFFVIETKTRSKPRWGRAKVELMDGRVLVAGHAPDRDPLVQARAGARWLADTLERTTLKRFPVRGVVLFPGWFVERMDAGWRRSPDQPWVLSPPALSKFIEYEKPQIAMTDVKLAAEHLAAYVRAQR